MEYLINLVGNYSIGWGITIIAALVFLVLCYRKVENYFSDKAIHEKEKNEQFKKVMDQVNMYPSWHQQSIEIQQQFNKSIAELKEGMDVAPSAGAWIEITLISGTLIRLPSLPPRERGLKCLLCLPALFELRRSLRGSVD